MTFEKSNGPGIDNYSPDIGEVRQIATPPAVSTRAQAAPLAANASASSAYSSDIQNIVAACQGDPKKLFDFVCNNIRYTPYFGFRKGADLTWICKSGNDADQADLLFTLLQAAGYSNAQFEYGVLTVPASMGRAWFGADNDGALDWMVGSSGYYHSLDSANGLFSLDHVWVQVSINGTVYRLLPSYRLFSSGSGSDLAASMSYNSSDLLASGSGTETSAYAQGISDSGVTGYLKNCSLNLIQSVLSSANPNASVDDITGARHSIPVQTTDLGSAFPSGVPVSYNFTFSTPDPSLCEKLSVIVGPSNGNGSISYEVAGFGNATTRSIYGRKISVTFSPTDGTAQVWLDDTLLSQ